MVFVLDIRKQPLMPCSEKRARQLLARKRAVIHRVMPFTIRLTDRPAAASDLQPVVLKLDPGSKTTGMALVRESATEAGVIHHALHLAHLEHRGEAVHKALVRRAGYRRRRRSVHLRYRAPRFLNRRRAPGWLPPSLRSRVDNVVQWSRRYQRLVPIGRIEVERVTFDTQLLQNSEISGIAYQRGELAGWEIRAYLLEKWGRNAYFLPMPEGRGIRRRRSDEEIRGIYRASSMARIKPTATASQSNERAHVTHCCCAGQAGL